MIVGAGAIGGFVAARLHAAGASVLLVEANDEHVEAIRERGLRVTGAETLHVRPRVLRPGELWGEVRDVLLAVKARDTLRALAPVAARLTSDGCIVSLQNGLEEYRIAATVGESRTLGAALTFGGHYVQPGVIAYGGPGSLHLGELHGGTTARLGRFAELLSLAHHVEVTDTIIGHLWGKTALAAFYFATALMDADVLEILERDDVLEDLGGLVAEVVNVAAAEGVECQLVDGFDPRSFALADRDGIRASWEAQRLYWSRQQVRRTGVWRDLWVHRRPTELREILGPVIERAELRDVPVVRLRRLAARVEAVERSGAAPSRRPRWSYFSTIETVAESRSTRPSGRSSTGGT